MADKKIKVGTTVKFEDNSTSDTTPISYYWNFGVGTNEGTSTEKSPSHVYSTIGLYTVSHDVTNPCGTTTCESKTVEVVEELQPFPTVMLVGVALLGFMMMAKK